MTRVGSSACGDGEERNENNDAHTQLRVFSFAGAPSPLPRVVMPPMSAPTSRLATLAARVLASTAAAAGPASVAAAAAALAAPAHARAYIKVPVRNSNVSLVACLGRCVGSWGV